ncbi:MAG: HAMP domain-containing histidine kinase [Gammaproteobacteria bacterium]|nr:HAMP domain-containing histidine kinase [Gammaproteobacteria bacterium]MBU2056586.1 HAMP domain-containing histidine kinase [Gammaproteobacteria bacterium]MBU2173603.1 HAMP domain-containing histidine kinase [Gammaproteobacteria bacterium]MBU2247384.1 HAMP domain-containing histidine kinase [Gammaproteobacteria bacterium]MBU2343548.1 HAMP domain-containing histidine kinase [Gammaproteobacteria bacterium]
MHKPARSLGQRIIWAFVILALLCASLFSFFNVIFVYTVEDQFFRHQLMDEQKRQLQQQQLSAPQSPAIQIYLQTKDLPADLQLVLEPATQRTEYSGLDGRHYHLRRFVHPAAKEPVWLVAEVSQQLVVRPIRDEMFLFYGISTLCMLLLAAALGFALARRATRPLTQLAELVQNDRFSPGFAKAFPNNEIGVLAEALEQNWQRVQAFIAREQAFSRDASHELRTPLAVIQSSCELLLAQGSTQAWSAEQQQRLEQIQHSSRQMNQLISTLLAVSREQHLGQKENIRLAALLEQLVLNLSPLLDGKSIEPELQVAPDLQLQLNPVLLQMVLTNLLQNAFLHSAPGTVHISADSLGLLISNPLQAEEAPTELTALFAKGRQSTGYGLGLGIVQRLCQQTGLELQLNRSEQQLIVRLIWPGST